MATLDWQAWLTIGVVLATLGMLLWERFTPDKVMLGVVAVLMASGVLGPREALAGFWNPGVLTVAVLFVLVAALKSTGAIRWIGDWVLGRPRGEWRAQARLVGIASPLSAFINNTPIVAMLTSAIEHWSRRSGIAPSKLLMPMNYATILGGMCTLVGTSTNLIVAGLVLQAGLPALHMFTPLGVGAAAAIAGGVYLMTLGRWLLPERRSALQQASADTREYSVEMLVEPSGDVAGLTIGQARLRHLTGSYLLELIRDDRVHAAVGPGMTLQAGDRLVFVGAVDAVRELRRIPGLRPATDQVFKIDVAGGQRRLAEVVLSRFNPAIGKTLVESTFRSHYNAAVIAISRRGRRLAEKPGEAVLQPGDTLLVETDAGFLQRHGGSPDFLVATEIDGDARVDRRGAITVLSIIGLMVVANTVFGVDILLSALAAAVASIVARCVSLAELRRSFDLQLIVVIACSFALGAALDHSGVAAVAAGELTPEDAALLLDELKQTSVVEAEGRDDEAPVPQTANRLRVRAVGRRVRLIGEPFVTTVAVDGPHVVRQEGDTLIVTSEGEFGASLDGFTLTPPRNLRDVREKIVDLGRELSIRVNPALIVEAEVTAGSINAERLPRLEQVRATAASVRVRDVEGPIDLLVQAGSAQVEGKITNGRSRLRTESGSLQLRLLRGTSARIRQDVQLGRVVWEPSSNGKHDERIVGLGEARIDLEVVMGQATVKEAP